MTDGAWSCGRPPLTRWSDRELEEAWGAIEAYLDLSDDFAPEHQDRQDALEAEQDRRDAARKKRTEAPKSSP